MPSLKAIIYTNDLVAPNDDIKIPNAPSGLKIFSFDEFVETGDTDKYPPTPPPPTSTAVIMYTSGSTGKPKGVVITHASVATGAASAEALLALKPSDEYLAYLPLAHIMELMVEFVCLASAVSLNYADPKSLTATVSVDPNRRSSFILENLCNLTRCFFYEGSVSDGRFGSF